MEEKQVENFIRKFERHMFWKKFRKGALIKTLRFISFFLTFSCIGISLLSSVTGKRIDQIDNFMPFIQIVFIFYAFLNFIFHAFFNTNFFEEKTIEKINVPEFEKYLEKEEYTGMEIDRKIIEEFLLNKEITEEVEEGVATEIINF